jgi:hypothetical protein
LGRNIVDTGTLAMIALLAFFFGAGFVGAGMEGAGWGYAGLAVVGVLAILTGCVSAFLAATQYYREKLPEVELEKMREKTRIEEARIADERVRQSWTVSDSQIVQIARKYGGALTGTFLAYETGQSLSTVDRSLQRFVEYREARMVNCGDMTIYDVPSARVHLLGVDKMAVELLLAHAG